MLWPSYVERRASGGYENGLASTGRRSAGAAALAVIRIGVVHRHLRPLLLVLFGVADIAVFLAGIAPAVMLLGVILGFLLVPSRPAHDSPRFSRLGTLAAVTLGIIVSAVFLAFGDYAAIAGMVGVITVALRLRLLNWS